VRAIEQAGRRAAKARRQRENSPLSPLSLWTDCNRTIHQTEAYAIHERDRAGAGRRISQALTRNRLLPGAFVPAAKYIRAQQLRAALCQEFADAMRDLDAVVTLSSLLLPCRIDDPAAIARTYDLQCRLVFNVTGTARHLGADRLHRGWRAARHADRRPRLRRADGLSDCARLLARRPDLPTGARRSRLREKAATPA
jgi:Asp-tRNA(Asn)/Glu-tRNA(Gln) amidotransferase A subunit family amidase